MQCMWYLSNEIMKKNICEKYRYHLDDIFQKNSLYKIIVQDDH